jgi:hypothetical protein
MHPEGYGCGHDGAPRHAVLARDLLWQLSTNVALLLLPSMLDRRFMFLAWLRTSTSATLEAARYNWLGREA